MELVEDGPSVSVVVKEVGCQRLYVRSFTEQRERSVLVRQLRPRIDNIESPNVYLLLGVYRSSSPLDQHTCHDPSSYAAPTEEQTYR
jgi:hypothetical protein